jgi:hypothetical protein
LQGDKILRNHVPYAPASILHRYSGLSVNKTTSLHRHARHCFETTRKEQGQVRIAIRRAHRPGACASNGGSDVGVTLKERRGYKLRTFSVEGVVDELWIHVTLEAVWREGIRRADVSSGPNTFANETAASTATGRTLSCSSAINFVKSGMKSVLTTCKCRGAVCVVYDCLCEYLCPTF